MTDLAIRVDHCILRSLLSLSKGRVEGCILSGVEGLSKLYPSTPLRAGHIGRAQQRHDTTSARLSAGLRDAISDFRLAIADLTQPNRKSAIQNQKSEDLGALRDVSFKVKQGEVGGNTRPRRQPAGEPVLSAIEGWAPASIPILRLGSGQG